MSQTEETNILSVLYKLIDLAALPLGWGGAVADKTTLYRAAKTCLRSIKGGESINADDIVINNDGMIHIRTSTKEVVALPAPDKMHAGEALAAANEIIVLLEGVPKTRRGELCLRLAHWVVDTAPKPKTKEEVEHDEALLALRKSILETMGIDT